MVWTSIIANLITQLFLWGVLNLFFLHYLSVLFLTEVFICLLESLALYYIRANHLRFTEAVLLSLSMNLLSFGLGWFLPI
jgi:hypothetical protein